MKLPFHEFSLQVYLEDTDAGGIVYHANYLKFAERARSDWLRSLGFRKKDLQEQQNLVFVVRSIEIEYLAPAVQDDWLRIETKLVDIQNTSMVMSQTIWRETTNLTKLLVKLAVLNMEQMKPMRLPGDLKRALIGNPGANGVKDE